MNDLKHSLKADAIANLYRAAFYLAKGEQTSALAFLSKSAKEINLKNLKPILENPKKELSDLQKKRFWAEKTLDEYRRLFNSL